MAYKLIELVGGTENPLTSEMESFWLYFDFAVAAANGQLSVRNGFFATHVSRLKPPRVVDPSWTSYNYKVEGITGLGFFTVKHAQPRERRAAELINEYGRLSVYEFDSTQPPTGWFDGTAWKASFEHPLYTPENKELDLSRYLFHLLQIGGKLVTDRWVHAVDARQTNAGGTASVSVVTPFTNDPVFGAILSQASIADPKTDGYMPSVTLQTMYGQDTTVDKSWTHFHGNATKLPGKAVEGYVMIAQGAFKAITIGSELDNWHMTQSAGWNAERVTNRLASLIQKYPAMRRNLETVGESEGNSIVSPPADNLPVEVLYMKGLSSPKPVF